MIYVSCFWSHWALRSQDNDNDDIPMEPTLPKMEEKGSELVDNAEGMQFSEGEPNMVNSPTEYLTQRVRLQKIPNHLAQ